MSNIDKAIEVLDRLDYEWDYKDGPWPDNETIVKALADAGLLAPELPPVTASKMWWPTKDVSIGITDGLKILLELSDPYVVYNPLAAKEVALALLAAANYAEEKK